ncbi:hypothetical protein DFJ67_3994 [Asanoa ferruginea]|uniref:Uncharacterized protein n=1 Tax=Asanoa ferruginea TaxID=53367 RepID=A0A3D9ZL37_9ACTN|nr:hypothetical protein DFJ67_3994 [Asanoa ferruginea]
MRLRSLPGGRAARLRAGWALCGLGLCGLGFARAGLRPPGLRAGWASCGLGFARAGLRPPGLRAGWAPGGAGHCPCRTRWGRAPFGRARGSLLRRLVSGRLGSAGARLDPAGLRAGGLGWSPLHTASHSRAAAGAVARSSVCDHPGPPPPATHRPPPNRRRQPRKTNGGGHERPQSSDNVCKLAAPRIDSSPRRAGVRGLASAGLFARTAGTVPSGAGPSNDASPRRAAAGEVRTPTAVPFRGSV